MRLWFFICHYHYYYFFVVSLIFDVFFNVSIHRCWIVAVFCRFIQIWGWNSTYWMGFFNVFLCLFIRWFVWYRRYRSLLLVSILIFQYFVILLLFIIQLIFKYYLTWFWLIHSFNFYFFIIIYYSIYFLNIIWFDLG